MKQKAKELVDKFENIDLPCSCGNESTCDVCVCGYVDRPHAKQCSLICVDEILELTVLYWELNTTPKNNRKYWEGVKQEIEKL